MSEQRRRELPIRALRPDQSRERSLLFLLRSTARMLELNDFKGDHTAATALRAFSNSFTLEPVDKHWEITFNDSKVRVPKADFKFYQVQRESVSSVEATTQGLKNRERAIQIVLELCRLSASSPTPERSKKYRVGTAHLQIHAILIALLISPTFIVLVMVAGCLAFAKHSRIAGAWLVAVSSGLASFVVLTWNQQALLLLSSEPRLIVSVIALFVASANLGLFASQFDNKHRAHWLIIAFIFLTVGTLIWFSTRDILFLLAGIFLSSFAGLTRVYFRSRPLIRVAVTAIASVTMTTWALMHGDTSTPTPGAIGIFGLAGAVLFTMSLLMFFRSDEPEVRTILFLAVVPFFISAPELWFPFSVSISLGLASFGVMSVLLRLTTRRFQKSKRENPE